FHNAARAKNLDSLPYRRARYAELFGQPALRRKRLPRLQHALDYQALYFLRNHIGEILLTTRCCGRNFSPRCWYDHCPLPPSRLNFTRAAVPQHAAAFDENSGYNTIPVTTKLVRPV